jgi:hypothetical protein
LGIVNQSGNIIIGESIFKKCPVDGWTCLSGGKMMKKLVYIVGILVLFYFAFHSRQFQQKTDNFIKQNEAHEQKRLDEFLSNQN